ncbi:MAG: carboxymuconolactone decarboxylase family protein [Nitrospirales bacterium]|nr:carboxymuconolactone decarboxylase family protein [Nitrospirales bacterium]
MPRLPAMNPNTATGQAQRLLNGVQSKLGFAPNIMRTMANSPSVLQGYLDFSGALSKGQLSSRFREQIALTVSEVNDCRYCLAAHSAIGRTVGLSEEAISDSRRGESPDAKEAAGLEFTRQVVSNRGQVTDGEVTKLRKAGFTDGEITEILANIALTLFTNYFNHVAGTEVDFPAASELEARV